jgi:uncharacterized repeat protein (TIGR01451 family)
MRIPHILLTTNLLILLSGYTLMAQAADGTIKVRSIAEVEVTLIGKDGQKEIRRITPDKAVPGTEVIFTDTFENVGNQSASDIVISNPIPANMDYREGSAFGKECSIAFSADGGKKFGPPDALKIKDAEGKERTALPKEYTHIRWIYQGHLSAGKSGAVGFRAAIR